MIHILNLKSNNRPSSFGKIEDDDEISKISQVIKSKSEKIIEVDENPPPNVMLANQEKEKINSEKAREDENKAVIANVIQNFNSIECRT